MKNRGIRKQVMILALLPALAVGIILSGYFTYTQLRYITDSLHEHGRSTVSQIAPSAEYAVFSGNTRSLRRALKNTLEQDSEIVRITIYNEDGVALLSVANAPPVRHYPKLLQTLLSDEQRLEFRAPITTEEVQLSDFDDNMMLTRDGGDQSRTIGYAELTLTTLHSTAQKIQTLLKGGLLTLAILLLSSLIAMRISKRIAQPVQMMTKAVRKIAAGDYDTQIRQDAPGELAILEECVNSMADELRAARYDMESRIDEFTLELQQTLEELEIRNAELDITRSKAMQASHAKSEFLANMSHEIRTPLSGILGFTELLSHTALDAQQRDYIGTIQKSAGNLLTIIDDILDLSKIESGKLNISCTSINLLDIVEDVIDLLTPIAYESNIELFYKLEGDVPRFVHADPVRIRQVLLNLVGNAVKFTDEGYVYLHIENDSSAQDSSIKFSVCDTGIGMSPDSKQKLFTAFTQADTSITRKFGGTGLGLVISRKLVLLMNGEIGFDSTQGEGSTFWFRIPVTVQNSHAVQTPAALQGVQVALVDEQRLCRDALASVFRQWGCEVKELSLGQLKVDRMTDGETRIDVVVIGISRKHLPSMERYASLVRKLNRQGLPTLVITSTRTHAEIDTLDIHSRNKAVFRTSRQSSIQNALADLVGRAVPAAAGAQAKDEPYRSESRLPCIDVLVVDDNDINLRLAEIILSRQGLNVATARSGDESIDLCKKHCYDLIFMDLHMPGIDGYETARRIRLFSDEQHARPVIIALTANAMKQEIERIHEFGMDDLVIKPISEMLIHDIIKKWFPPEEGGGREPPAKPTHAVAQDEDEDDSAVFSLPAAARKADGNERLALELFRMLQESLPAHREEIVSALKNAAWSELKEHTHKINGAGKCCGTPALQQAANALEQEIDNGAPEQVREYTEALLAEMDRVQQWAVPDDTQADSRTTTAAE